MSTRPELVRAKAATKKQSIMGFIGYQLGQQPPKWSLFVKKLQHKPASGASAEPCLSKSRAASQHHEHHWEPVRTSLPKPASIMSLSRRLSVRKPPQPASIMSIIGNQSGQQPQNNPASRASARACLSKSPRCRPIS